MSNKKQEFLEKPLENNIDFAAQMIIANFTDAQFMQLRANLLKLDKALFKSYLKEMPLNEILEAVETVYTLIE